MSSSRAVRSPRTVAALRAEPHRSDDDASALAPAMRAMAIAMPAARRASVMTMTAEASTVVAMMAIVPMASPGDLLDLAGRRLLRRYSGIRKRGRPCHGAQQQRRNRREWK